VAGGGAAMRVSSHPRMASGWRARLEGANSTEVQQSQRRATGGQWVADSTEAQPMGSGLRLKRADSVKLRDRGEAERKEWIHRREREKKKKPLEEDCAFSHDNRGPSGFSFSFLFWSEI
jgi:hypothetical protein